MLTRCPHCSKAIKISQEHLDEVVYCPACRRSLVVKSPIVRAPPVVVPPPVKIPYRTIRTISYRTARTIRTIVAGADLAPKRILRVPCSRSSGNRVRHVISAALRPKSRHEARQDSICPGPRFPKLPAGPIKLTIRIAGVGFSPIFHVR